MTSLLVPAVPKPEPHFDMRGEPKNRTKTGTRILTAHIQNWAFAVLWSTDRV